MCGNGLVLPQGAEVVDTMQVGDDSRRDVAAAAARARDVLDGASFGATRCLCCCEEAPLARVVVFKSRAVGRSCDAVPFAGVCARCLDACSEARRDELGDLVRTARHCDSILMLIRQRAEQLLAPFYGGVGNCTRVDIDAASVAVRRAIERIGGRS